MIYLASNLVMRGSLCCPVGSYARIKRKMV
jgi:hypothetical protein